MASGQTWQTELLVVQGTAFCNLDCSYCYLPNRSDHSRISIETLRLVFERLFESPFVGPALTVVWHSGEPLVLPIDFYRSAFAVAERLRPRSVNVTHSFQTNGTLLNDQWARFILETGARVGVSIDGPEELHDRCRRMRSGVGTFGRTLNGIRTLQAFGVPFHVITVLTAESLLHPDELYDFYKETNITHVCFNVEEIESVNTQSSLSGPDALIRYRDFMERMLELVKEDRATPLWIRELDGASSSIAHFTRSTVDNPQTTPFAILSVDRDGNVSTFSPELLGASSQQYEDFIIGNVRDQSLLEMSRSVAFRKMLQDINEGVEACQRTCSYFQLCGGGAPANKHFENGSFASTETMFCRLCRQAIIDVVLEDMERTLAECPGADSSQKVRLQ